MYWTQKSNEWVLTHIDSLTNRLDNYLSKKLTVTIEVTAKSAPNNKFVVPVIPDSDDYDDDDYGDYNDDDYGDYNDDDDDDDDD